VPPQKKKMNPPPQSHSKMTQKRPKKKPGKIKKNAPV